MSDALIYAKNTLELEKENPGYLDSGLMLLARTVVRQDEEIQRLKSTLEMVEKGDSAKMNAQIDEINALRNKVAKLTCSGDCLHNCNCIPAIERKEELVALKEKYRWLRYPDEAPTEDCTCLIIVKLYGVEGNPYRTILADYHSAQSMFRVHDKYETGYCSGVRFWRPVDLPEEEM